MAEGALVAVQPWCMFLDLILRGGVNHGGRCIGGGAAVVHVLGSYSSWRRETRRKVHCWRCSRGACSWILFFVAVSNTAKGVSVAAQPWCMFLDLILRGGVKHGDGCIGGGAVVVQVHVSRWSLPISIVFGEELNRKNLSTGSGICAPFHV